jgi:hypothetical protein
LAIYAVGKWQEFCCGKMAGAKTQKRRMHGSTLRPCTSFVSVSPPNKTTIPPFPHESISSRVLFGGAKLLSSCEPCTCWRSATTTCLAKNICLGALNKWGTLHGALVHSNDLLHYRLLNDFHRLHNMLDVLNLRNLWENPKKSCSTLCTISWGT